MSRAVLNSLRWKLERYVAEAQRQRDWNLKWLGAALDSVPPDYIEARHKLYGQEWCRGRIDAFTFMLEMIDELLKHEV